MTQSSISWIISIGFIVLLGIGFLIGLWRGWKRSLLNFGCSIIGMIVAIFVTKPITTAIMGIEVTSDGVKTSLSGLIVKELQKNEDINLMMNANANFKQFIYGLPSALASTLVFVAVSAVVALLAYTIYRIACIGVKYRPAERKHRLVGAGVGTVKMLILSSIALMPLTSLIGLTSDMTERESFVVSAQAENQTGSPYGYIGEYIPEQAIVAVRGVNDSLLSKICGLGGMDDKLFDFYGQVKVDDKQVLVREEVPAYYEVLAFKYDIEHTTNLSFSNVNYEKLGKVVDKVVESPLFTKVVSSTLADMIINYEDYSFMAGLKDEYGKILDNIGSSLSAIESAGGNVSEYFAHDIKTAVEIFKTMGANGVIDDIKALENKNADSIIETLENESEKEGKLTNKDSFDSAVSSFFKMNTVRDSIAEILKKYSKDFINGLDEVGVDTSAWTDENWDKQAVDISKFVKSYADLVKDVKFADIITDATILLDSSKDYDILGIMTNLGSLIDNARSIELLRTSDNKPIFDKLLTDNNIVLPDKSAEIKNASGEKVTISNYTDLFGFVAPSLEKLKSSGMYDVITGEGDKVKGIANIVSFQNETGTYPNKDILKEIILPLNQVEPTKSLIMDSLTSSLGSGFIDLSGLNTYDEWDKDLGYISSLLIVLNTDKMPDGVTTYLDKVLDNKIDEVFDNLADEQVDGIIKPILYAKATTTLKNDIMSQIAQECNSLTGASDTISLAGVTLEKGNPDDQANEICAVMKSLIALRGESGNLKDMNEGKVKTMLISLQANGYRTIINTSLTSEGAFKGIFGSVMSKFKGELAEYDSACEAKYGKSTVEKIEDMCGEQNYLQTSNYGKIDFGKVFENINSLKTELDSLI